MIYNENSKIKDVLKSPLGNDILSKVLSTMNKDLKLVDNPIVGNLKLSFLKRFVPNSFVEALIDLINTNVDESIDLNVSYAKAWFKEAIFYQIYPSSFCDSNHDGIGDINGIIKHLDYLKDLGVNALWLSPIYDSPMDDNGYDIRDYHKILDTFGTMEDFDNLLKEVHDRDMYLIMDLVVNHTSDEHEWYQKFLKGDKEYEDYYITSKEKNNWTSWFDGDAWNYIEDKDLYSLHLFSKKQIDLNWKNPKVRREVIDIVKFWLDKGVDGFRMDTINLISKRDLNDGNELVYQMMGIRGIERYFYGDKLHEYLKELIKEGFKPYNAISVGETPGIGLKTAELLTHESRHELDMIFNFDVLESDGHARFDIYDYNLAYLKKYYTEWLNNYHGHMALFIENHDNPRIISKIDHTNKYRYMLAKLICTLELTLKGTPFIYQGQELGLTNVDFKSMDEIRDIESINRYQKLGADDKAFEHILYGSRDHARVPMIFDDGPYYGFSDVKPWIRLNDDGKLHNIKAQLKDDNSVLNYYKKMIEFRKKHLDEIVYGDIEFINSIKELFIYKRGDVLIEANLSDKEIKRQYQYSSVLSNADDKEYLSAYEVKVYVLNN